MLGIAVLLAASLLFYPVPARAQRVASPEEVFGNPISKEAEEWLTDSNARYNEAQNRLQEQWLSDVPSFQVDLERGNLIFTAPKRKVIFDIRVIGTVRHVDRSWEWAWNNPTVPARLKVSAERFFELGQRYDLRYLTRGMVPVPMAEFPFMLSGIALKLYGGVGVYRAPSEELDLYLLLANPSEEVRR